MNDTETITIPLSRPFAHKDKTYSEMTFRETTAGDLAAGDAVTGNMNRTLVTLACMAGVELSVMKAVRARDLNLIMKKVAFLMGEPTEADGPTS